MNDQQRVLAIIQRVSKKNVSPDPDESLFESGILDSFALPDVVTEIEKEFAIEVPDGDLTPRKFDSISRIAEYIDSRK